MQVVRQHRKQVSAADSVVHPSNSRNASLLRWLFLLRWSIGGLWSLHSCRGGPITTSRTTGIQGWRRSSWASTRREQKLREMTMAGSLARLSNLLQSITYAMSLMGDSTLTQQTMEVPLWCRQQFPAWFHLGCRKTQVVKLCNAWMTSRPSWTRYFDSTAWCTRAWWKAVKGMQQLLSDAHDLV